MSLPDDLRLLAESKAVVYGPDGTGPGDGSVFRWVRENGWSPCPDEWLGTPEAALRRFQEAHEMNLNPSPLRVVGTGGPCPVCGEPMVRTEGAETCRAHPGHFARGTFPSPTRGEVFGRLWARYGDYRSNSTRGWHEEIMRTARQR